MATTIQLSAGTGGAKLVSYVDVLGNSYAPAAVVYMTSTTDGAAAAQPVQVGHGLPVQQDGNFVVIPSDTVNTNPWLFSIKQGGNTATVDSGGALKVAGAVTVASITSITNPVTVAQSTPGNLLATVNIAAAQTLATVTNVGSVTSITNPVTIAQSTAANLLCTASQGGSWTVAATQSGTWNVGTLATITNPVTIAQSTAANLLATVNIASAQTLATVTTVGAVTSITNPVTVAQTTAANLNATVSIAAAQTLSTVTNVTTVGTITNPVGVAAGTNLIGKVANGDDTSTIYNGTTAITPTFAAINASASGDNTVVALVAGKKIRVLRWSLTASGTVNVKWRSNTTDLTGLRSLTLYASAGGGYCPIGIFETVAGQALNLNLSGATAVGGELTYILV